MCFPLLQCWLSLALLVLGIATDNLDPAMPFDDPALGANTFDGCGYFHRNFRQHSPALVVKEAAFSFPNRLVYSDFPAWGK
jgi:hypothetical protein